MEDERFDVVLCGMGLQFFSDRTAGLREIHRVLVPGGRFVANVPGPIPPPLRAMADGLARHVSPGSAGFVETVFSLHDGDELRGLAQEAGFRRVEVQSNETALELGAPAEFLWSYVHSTPIAAALSSVDREQLDALERDFTEACGPFLTDGALKAAVQMTTVVAVK